MHRSVLFVFFALFATAFAAFQPKQCGKGNKKTDVNFIKGKFTNPKAFCNYYLSEKRSLVPASGAPFTKPADAKLIKRFSNACECISKKKQSTKKQASIKRPGAAVKCVKADQNKLTKQVKNAAPFCKQWRTSTWRPASQAPFGKNLNVRQIYNACKCVLDPVKTSSSKTSSSKASSATSASSAAPVVTSASASTSASVATSSSVTTSASNSVTVLPVAQSSTTTTSAVSTSTGIDFISTTTTSAVSTSSASATTSDTTSATTSDTTSATTSATTTESASATTSASTSESTSATTTTTEASSTTSSQTATASPSNVGGGSTKKKMAMRLRGRQYSNAGAGKVDLE